MNRFTQTDIQARSQRSVLRADSQDMSRRVIHLQILTLAWMLAECGVALFSAYKARSPALLAFGSDSFVELLSATVVLLQFTPSVRLAPDRAARMTGVLLFLLAGVVCIEATIALVRGFGPNASWSGIAITVAALAVMPLLARAKRIAARQTGNRALGADAVQSATCAYLAATTLVGLLLNAFFHIRSIDPIAALAALPILCIEGWRALQGKTCDCCV